MLDSDSRYLPVLSEPSSGSSSPHVHRDNVEQKHTATDTAKPRRVVANFVNQPAAVQRSDVVFHPTKSASHPKSHSVAAHHHSQSPVARTLHLESSDALEIAADDSANTLSHCGTEQHQPTDVKWKPDRRLSDEHGVASLLSLYTPEKYQNSLRQIYDDDSKRTHTQWLTDIPSDTNSCAEKHSHLVKNDQSLYNAADIVIGSDHYVQGKSMCSFQKSF